MLPTPSFSKETPTVIPEGGNRESILTLPLTLTFSASATQPQGQGGFLLKARSNDGAVAGQQQAPPLNLPVPSS